MVKVLSINTTKWAMASNETGGKWVTKPFHNSKKAVAKMKTKINERAYIVRVKATEMFVKLRLVVSQQP